MDLTGSVQIGPFSLEIDSLNEHYWAEGSKSENLQLKIFGSNFLGYFLGRWAEKKLGDFGNNHFFDRSFKFYSNPTNSIFDPILTNFVGIQSWSNL